MSVWIDAEIYGRQVFRPLFWKAFGAAGAHVGQEDDEALREVTDTTAKSGCREACIRVRRQG